jgi:hypothetical protein
LFLEYTGLTEAEFYEIAISHKLDAVSSTTDIVISQKPPDLEKWQRHPGLSRTEKESAIALWKNEH